MGISMYYTVSRPYELSKVEQNELEGVIKRYSVKERIDESHRTGVGWNGEDFCLYGPPFESPETILQGATRLPDSNDEVLWTAVKHWCQALSEMRRLLFDAVWHVHVDDHDLEWNEERQEFDPVV